MKDHIEEYASQLRRISVPIKWSDVEHRVHQDSPDHDPEWLQAGGRKNNTARRAEARLAAAAAVFVLLSAAGLAVQRSRQYTSDVRTGAPAASGSSGPNVSTSLLATSTSTASVPLDAGTWSDLPAAPFQTNTIPGMVWTDKLVIIWNTDEAYDNGRAATFNPATQRWNELSPPPVLPAARTPAFNGAGIVWTATEAIVWSKPGFSAWNATQESWRALPPPPHPPDYGAVWTGQDLLFALDGLAFNPARSSWRRLATPSAELRSSVNTFNRSQVWTGREVAVVGTQSALYDPAANAWRDLSMPSLDGTTANAYFIDGKVIAISGLTPQARALDLASGSWADDPTLQPLLAASEGAPQMISVGPGLVYASHADRASLRTATGQWIPAEARNGAVLLTTGESVYALDYLGRLSEYVPPRN